EQERLIMGGFSLVPQNLPATGENPILTEIQRAHASLSPHAKLAIQQAAVQPPSSELDHAVMSGPSAVPPAPKMTMPPVASAPPTQAQARLNHLEDTGSGISQIHSLWARVPLQIAEGIGNAFAPAITQAIPGTQLHHNMLVNQAKSAVDTEDTLKN